MVGKIIPVMVIPVTEETRINCCNINILPTNMYIAGHTVYNGVSMNKSVYDAVKSGLSDNNIDFNDFRNLIVDLGFVFRNQEGSHRIYKHSGIREKMNIQPDGNKAKGYQVRQLRTIIRKHNL